jgi:2,3-bisphosphoglycerate-dependent phosphoglycerate mutase
MELFLIRHGQSTNNALDDWTQRVEDPLLTDGGQRQAECAALHLAAGMHLQPTAHAATRPVLDRLYCSPMIRALQTAHPIAKRIGVTPEVWVDIHEVGGIYLDHGERKVGYPGRTRGELARLFPDCILPPELTEQGWWNRDFEELHQGQARAVVVAQALRRRAGEDARIGMVSHGDFLSALLKALGDQHPAEGPYYEHRNTGITHIDLTPQGARVRYLNRVDHLDDEALITY